MSLSQILEGPALEQVQGLLETFPYSGWQVAGGLTGTYLTYKLAKLLKTWIIDPRYSPLRDLPGPESYESIIWGNMLEVFRAPPLALHEEWFNKYGHTITYRGLLLAPRLSTKDPRALAHIINHGYDYPKPRQMRDMLSSIFGKGVLFAEGDDHRRQRKIMNPCFGPGRIRDLMPIFYDKALELRDIWIRQIAEGGPDGKEIDVLVWLTRVTLDIIGLAGFGYEFDTLANGEQNELVKAFMDLFAPNQEINGVAMFAAMIPGLRSIPTERGRVVKQSKAVMERVGLQLVKEKRAAIIAASKSEEGLEKKTVGGRDLLSVLIAANMATDVKESERMSDEEVSGQIRTMLIAGHETTATSITWLLYDLARPQYQHVQTKLREELETLTSDSPTMEELNSLPYLDAVVRENLRFRSVADSTIRSAEKDDIIPVSTPYKDRNGVERMEFRIGAKEQILIPIGSLNRDKAIWGEDANEFKPERWIEGNTHPRSAEVPGVFAGVLSFLGGPRSCIGYRFALMEMKVLIFALIRNISYELPDQPPLIEKKSQLVTRPAIKQADGKYKNSMPLKMKILRSD
ncbi:hypothetical protein FRB90_009783 [Tulasnella sp. 427]|nr:hypothetical protein FRB90_009783 [Tulasnella sp. 427]